MLEHANRLKGIPTTSPPHFRAVSVDLRRAGRRVISTRVDSPEGLEGVLVIPHEPVSTNDARMAIPAEVPVGDLVGNVSAAALLTLGLSRGDFDLISPASGTTSIRTAGGTCFRARWKWWRRQVSSVRSERPSPVPDRPCSSGQAGRRPDRSSRRFATTAGTGRTFAGSGSAPSARTCPSSRPMAGQSPDKPDTVPDQEKVEVGVAQLDGIFRVPDWLR